MFEKCQRGFNFLLRLFFPRRCVMCRHEGSYVCQICRPHLPTKTNFFEEGIYTLFEYDQPAIKRLLWLLKYRGIRDIAPLLGNLLYEQFLEEIADIKQLTSQNEKIILVPIPLSLKRLRARGFNQSATIAQALAAADPTSFQLEETVLTKIRETPTQVSVRKRADRLANLKGAFSLANPEKLKNRIVIILDDVATTGATLAEATKTVSLAHPLKILKMVIAHG